MSNDKEINYKLISADLLDALLSLTYEEDGEFFLWTKSGVNITQDIGHVIDAARESLL